MTVAEMIARRTTELTAIKADSNAAVAAKGGTPADNLLGLPAAIESIPSGGDLPKLTTPAEVGHVVAGKEYIDAAGNKQTGTLVVCDTIQEVETIGIAGTGVSLEIESTADGSVKTMTLPEPNLKSENIVVGSSIFGVSGTAKTLRVDTGTFTLAEDTQAPAITHNLGVIPDLVIVEAEDHDNMENSIFGFVAVRAGLLICAQFGGTIFIINGNGVEFNGAANINGKNAFDSGLSDTGFVCAYNSSNYKYRAGWTYRWTVFAGLA